MEARRLLLTNLNPSVFKKRFLDSFLSELVINSLLYGEVLIREDDLITNRWIATHLVDDDHLRIFEELLSVGAVRVLRLPERSYAPDLPIDPNYYPISARAKDHEDRRTLAGRQFIPTRRQSILYPRLDEIVRRSPISTKTQKPFPAKNRFATKLADLLIKRAEYRIQSHPAYSSIDDKTADLFIKFCNDPDTCWCFLKGKGVQKPFLGTEGGFYRTAAYQCCEHLPGDAAKGMQRLVESMYATCDCERENAHGRYGKGALAELPYRFCPGFSEQECKTRIKKLEFVPVSENAILLRLGPGIGDIIAKTRESEAFLRLQSLLRLFEGENDPPPSTAFAAAWLGISDEFAINQQRMLPASSMDKMTGRVSAIIYLFTSGMFGGFGAIHTYGGFEWKVLTDALVINRIEHWVPSLSKTIRALVQLPRIRRIMNASATSRCSNPN